MVLRLALLPILPLPVPQVHDEFSYLLGADTFASGRLTNPAHPLWPFFETFHVLQQPTYQSKFPPAQALFMASGKVLFGHPWFGVLLASALLCAASCWMLQAWMPSYIAFWGGIVMVLHVGVSSYWVNSYWGGAVAALGGCIVIGAVRRLADRVSAKNCLAAAAGIALLANSRPYEGLLLMVSSIAVLLIWKSPRLPLLALAPAAAFLAVMAGAMLFYNYRVTGHARELPWQTYDRQYAVTSAFRFSPLRPVPSYRYVALRDFFAGDQVAELNEASTHPIRKIKKDTAGVVEFFPGLSPLWIPLLAFPFALGHPDARAVAAIAIAFWTGMLLEKGFLPHYPAPALGLALLMSAFGLRYLRLLGRKSSRDGVMLVRIVTILFLMPLVVSTLQVRAVFHQPNYRVRDQIAASLAQKYGRVLIVARYASPHDFHGEWVFNDADIDHAPVVWAHDLGDKENRRLLDYFRDRSAWLFEPDAQPAILKPYRIADPPALADAGLKSVP